MIVGRFMHMRTIAAQLRGALRVQAPPWLAGDAYGVRMNLDGGYTGSRPRP
jgi:hypothetical protein